MRYLMVLRLQTSHAEELNAQAESATPVSATAYPRVMAYPTDLLTKDEAIALDLRPHWATMLGPASAVVGSVILAILLFAFVDVAVLQWIGLGLVGAALLAFAWRWVIWHNTQFVVTNERVISRVGVVAKNGLEIPLDQISAVTFHVSVIERLVGAGDLGIESSSEGGVQTFSNVRKPNQVQQEIYRMMENLEERRLQRMGEAAGGAPASIPEQIQQLENLRQAGTLTNAEFEASKAALLRQL